MEHSIRKFIKGKAALFSIDLDKFIDVVNGRLQEKTKRIFKKGLNNPKQKELYQNGSLT